MRPDFEWFNTPANFSHRLTGSMADLYRSYAKAGNPTISLEDDVEVTKRALAAQDGPTLLVGHSYKRVVM
jgi:protein tyrosine phosphatase (PTP) superfamily phosphohydrolase (DUF442 family)